jgi:hypothetical protein
MERRLESISIKYWQTYWDDGEEIKNIPSIVVTYRNILDGIPQKIDTIVIGKDTDYSIYEEKIQKICQIAFEEQ